MGGELVGAAWDEPDQCGSLEFFLRHSNGESI